MHINLSLSEQASPDKLSVNMDSKSRFHPVHSPPRKRSKNSQNKLGDEDESESSSESSSVSPPLPVIVTRENSDKTSKRKKLTKDH